MLRAYIAFAMAATLTMCIATHSIAQESTNQNAALEYYRAFLLLDYLPEGMQDVNNPDFGGLSESNKRAIKSIRKDDLWVLISATRLPDCDWGDHCINGPETYLPQIAPHRRMALLMYYNAMLYIEENRIDQGIEAIASIINMAHHLVLADDVAVCAITAQKELEYAKLAIEAVPNELITQDHRERIMQSLQRFDESDPLEFKSNALSEIRCFSGWVRRTTAEMNFFQLRKFFGDWIDMVEPKPFIAFAEWPLITNPDILPEQIDQYAKLVDEVARNWDSSDPKQALLNLDNAIAKGEHGPIPKMYMYRTAKYYQLFLGGEELYDEFLHLLDQ